MFLFVSSSLQDGYTALYIARRVMKNTTIIETLTKVTKVQQIITLINKPVST